jgi:4-alpha-glucanotransferase
MSSSRLAGVTIPLFSIRTRRDWGIGQIDDLPACAAWIRRAGHRLLQILPPYELAAGETSPYGARTGFGLDPIYIAIEKVEDLDAAAIDEVLGDAGRAERDRLRALPHVDYAAVRTLKMRPLRAAFARFREREWERKTPRAAELRAFIEGERSWADDLALYIAIRDARGGYGWESWPDELRRRDPHALARARVDLALPILEHHYFQWLAFTQWHRARTEMQSLGVELMGDLPFVVCGESADVWSHASEFQRGVSLGAPPDAFTPDGQDWGLPAYDWAAMAANDFAWLRARAHQAGRLYDRFRVDHVVGFFRMFLKRPGVAKGFFDPPGEPAQEVHGERVLRALVEGASPAKVIAEDLGVIPPFVRKTLLRLGIPGYKVIPWEKEQDRVFRPPAQFLASSVATFSTHDTAPITRWWDDFTPDEKDQLAHLAKFYNERTFITPDGRVHLLLKMLFEAGSDLTLTLAQELLGERTRINTPGTVGAENWTYRLPRPIEDLEGDPAIRARLESVRGLVIEAGR